MAYRGTVRGNAVTLEEGVKLPDGLDDFSKDPFLKVDEWAPEPAGEMPSDLAHQHDHYLYGAERRRIPPDGLRS